MNDEKQAVLSAIQKINAVEGFDPTPLAVEYVDLNTQEKRLRLPVMAQLAWFRLKYPEGRVSVAVTAAKDCFVATARVYPSYTNLPDQYLAEARQYPRANGRRPLPLVSPFEMPASDFSSAQPVIPLTLRPWTNWEASSGAGKTSPRRRHMKCQRQQPLRQPRRPPQNQ